VQSGEGIRPALESGLLAAKVIQSAEGRYDRDRLERFTTLLTERLSQGPSQATALAKHLPRGLRNRLARLLLSQEWFCRRVVVDNWFLHTHEPALL
jgi:flavin-dependent dehydrogenase